MQGLNEKLENASHRKHQSLDRLKERSAQYVEQVRTKVEQSMLSEEERKLNKMMKTSEKNFGFLQRLEN